MTDAAESLSSKAGTQPIHVHPDEVDVFVLTDGRGLYCAETNEVILGRSNGKFGPDGYESRFGFLLTEFQEPIPADRVVEFIANLRNPRIG